MPERTTTSEAVRAGAPVRVGGAVLLPIERILVHAGRGRGLVWSTATKELHALVVRDARGVRALGPDGGPVPLEPLRAAVPGLDDLLSPA